ncbi:MULTISPECIES: DUF262 domain-containing protein [Olivibacter]|uniref:DUF262 domain-containing protein n=1 Tax=Olivibacter jilunii TaxID=985016 RepID=A0ABW6B0R0_9SPHI
MFFIKKPNFTKELKQEITRRTDANVLESFDNLRYNKPAPISTPIDEILTDVSQNKYLIRPSYQREEKITLLKASSIIESILLGIALPPIFIFKRLDGVKEVIDGQQRLLSILGFLGKAYRSEKNELMFSKHNNYKLKGLEILSGLNGTSYQKLSEDFSEKLLDFAIDVIIIEEALNKDFEPTDLFIRLNNKPYPIKSNSFEMWNSTIDTKVIQTIKTVTNKHIEWFFIKETDIDPEERNDRMENEEFVTILAYLIYNSLYDSYDKIIGFFKKSDALSCRLVYKTGLTDFLGRLEQEEKEKEVFLNCIILTEKIITNLGMALGQDRPTKENLNTFLNVSNKPTYRRSLQDFYIIWIYLISFSQPHLITEDKLGTMIELLKYFRNTKGDKVDDKFVENFHKKLKSFYPSENVN